MKISGYEIKKKEKEMENDRREEEKREKEKLIDRMASGDYTGILEMILLEELELPREQIEKAINYYLSTEIHIRRKSEVLSSVRQTYIKLGETKKAKALEDKINTYQEWEWERDTLDAMTS